MSIFVRGLVRILSGIFNGTGRTEVTTYDHEVSEVSNSPAYVKKHIPAHLREAVWNAKFKGASEGVCYCCGIPIQKRGYHCSHVKSEKSGGETCFENLRCCCVGCNLSMQTTNLYTYVINKDLHGEARRKATKYLNKHPEEK